MLSPNQQMFMLFFSILYGIMLNSLIGIGAFPIADALARLDVITRVRGEPKYEKGDKSRKRCCLSFFLLNVAPFVYFAIAFQFLPCIGDISSTNFPYTIPQIVFIGLLSLSVFAFYQFFFGFVTWKPHDNPFYTLYDLKRLINERALHRSRYHFLAGFIYLVTPWIPIILCKVK